MRLLYSSVEIAYRIKKIAEEKNIQLKIMYEKLQLNKNTLTNLYKGSMIKSDSLAKIADYLDCSVDYLLGRSNQISTSQEVYTLNINEQHLIKEFRKLPKESQDNIIGFLNYCVFTTSGIYNSSDDEQILIAARNGKLTKTSSDNIKEKFNKMPPVDDLE